MFAPISRTFDASDEVTESLQKGTGAVCLPPYERNHILRPTSLKENMAYLKAWQSVFSGDSLYTIILLEGRIMGIWDMSIFPVSSVRILKNRIYGIKWLY